MERGQYGYLKSRQGHLFRMTVFCAAAVLLVAGIGFAIWHSRMNLLMIPAMLLVIPMANYLVAYLAVIPYHSAPDVYYQQVKPYDDANMLLSDLIIVDEKGKRAGLDFCLIYANAIVAYQSKAKDSKDLIEITINDIMKRRGIPLRCKVYKNWDEFAARILEIAPEVDEDHVRRVELASNAIISVTM